MLPKFALKPENCYFGTTHSNLRVKTCATWVWITSLTPMQCTGVAHRFVQTYCGIGLGDPVRDENGKPLISNAVFQAMLPPELWAMRGAYKLMCCCAIIQSFDYKQNALNRFCLHLLNDL